MEFTTHLELQSQTTRLVESRKHFSDERKRGCHPPWHSIPGDFVHLSSYILLLQTTFPKIKRLSFSRFTRRY